MAYREEFYMHDFSNIMIGLCFGLLFFDLLAGSSYVLEELRVVRNGNSPHSLGPIIFATTLGFIHMFNSMLSGSPSGKDPELLYSRPCKNVIELNLQHAFTCLVSFTIIILTHVFYHAKIPIPHAAIMLAFFLIVGHGSYVLMPRWTTAKEYHDN